MRLLVYSHDAFGLGNIRRMLSICQHLLQNVSGLSILVLSGSPALHSLRLPCGLDYIKLPCVSRSTIGKVGVRFLETPLVETIRLRSQLIQTAVANFQPDLFLVDKKPSGLEGELLPALYDLKTSRSQCKLVLMLRDILDAPEVTIRRWQQKNYYDLIANSYEQVWVGGTPNIFDVRREYQFPSAVARKVRFCGYIRRGIDVVPSAQMRSQLGITPESKMILVTAGGGGDGESLLKAYLQGLTANRSIRQDFSLKHVIVCGPEMPAQARQLLCQTASVHPQVRMLEFTPDLDSYMNAADVVVSMGGYNTICEILSLRKRAVVVPRHRPAREQLLRAERMAPLDVFRWIHPEELTADSLIQAVLSQLRRKTSDFHPSTKVDLNALPQMAQYLRQLLPDSIPALKTWGAAATLQFPTLHADCSKQAVAV